MWFIVVFFPLFCFIMLYFALFYKGIITRTSLQGHFYKVFSEIHAKNVGKKHRFLNAMCKGGGEGTCLLEEDVDPCDQN